MDRDAAEQLGRNLWRARRRAGYSQEALGVLCSLHRTEIGMIEKGKRLPRVDTLMKLADALGVRVESLLVGIEWVPPGPAAGGSFAVREGGRVDGEAREGSHAALLDPCGTRAHVAKRREDKEFLGRSCG